MPILGTLRQTLTTAIPPKTSGPTRAPTVIVPIAIFAVICPLLVTLRVWLRVRRRVKVGPDDYCVIGSLVFSLATAGVQVASCEYGYGQHFGNIQPQNALQAMKFFYFFEITYKTSLNLTKSSILLLYTRFSHHYGYRWFRYSCWVMVGIVALYGIYADVATIFQCTPIRRAWDKAVPGHCINNDKFWYANAGFSVATDLVILLMPMPLIKIVKIPAAEKGSLMAALSLGGVVVVISCLRMAGLATTAETADTTYNTWSNMWSLLEMNLAIVCACLPILRPAIFELFSSTRSMGSGGDMLATVTHGSAAADSTSEGIELRDITYSPGVNDDRDSQVHILD